VSLVTIEDRVDRLEALFGQFMTQTALLNKCADERDKTAEERNQLAEERNKAAEERMTRFESEMRAEREESRAFRREMNKKWGDLANKMGTIIEDILAPNLRRLAREHFHFDPIEDFMIRRSRRCPGQPERLSEFDTIVVGPEAVILGEAKSKSSIEWVDGFAEKRDSFFDFFPEYRGKRLILVFGSWAISDSLVDRMTGHGIYAMRMGEETMELVNASQIEGQSS